MDAKALQQLRPRDESAAGIAASINRMLEVLAELQDELAAHNDARRGVLTSGTNSELEKHDGRARALATDIERVQIAVDELRLDLAAARGRDRLADVEALRVEAEAATRAFNEFWAKRYEVLAREIAEGLDLERQARAASTVFAQAAARAMADANVAAAGGVPKHGTGSLPSAYVRTTMNSPSLLICLPAVAPGQGPIAWPAGHSLELVKRGKAAAYA
jgi:hypothetical protein